MGQFLRAEARPASWNALYITQQNAFRLAINMLLEAVDQLPPTQPKRAEGDWLRENKSSQIAFLFGARGTGKTTVFLSLDSTCNIQRPLADDVLRAFPPAVGEAISTLRRRLIWLQPLDMETAGESPNLLASIVTRIENACEDYLPPPSEQYYLRGQLDTEQVDPLHDMQKLLANVTIAWDGNLKDRRGHLDPDNFAIESIRCDQARLKLLDRLDSVLHDLARQIEKGNLVKNPVFVLPVDDFDLNPVSCVELLRVLRMVSLPRLFFLVLGDLTVADVVLNLKYSSDLVRVARGVTDEKLLSIPALEVSAIAGEIASNSLRKLIPPAQRITLREPTVGESLNFRPLPAHMAGKETSAVPRLHELLAKCPIRIYYLMMEGPTGYGGGDIRDARSYLTAPGTSLLTMKDPPLVMTVDDAIQEAALSRSYYSANRMLRAPSRRISDLWYGLQRLVDGYTGRLPTTFAATGSTNATSAATENSTTENMALDEFQADLCSFVASQCRAALAEEPALTPVERRTVPAAFQPSATDDWDLSSLPFRVATKVTPMYHVQYSVGGDWPDVSNEFIFNKVDGWRLRVGRRTVTGLSPLPDDAGRPVSEATAGNIELFHDLVLCGPWSDGRGTLLSESEQFAQNWASTVWREGLKVARLAWPAPGCATFLNMDSFIYTWNDFLRRASSLSDPEIGPSAAMFAWIVAGTAVVTGTTPLQFEPKNPENNPWDKLGQSLERVVPAPQDRSYAANLTRDWLVKVAGMMTPEMGLTYVPDDWSDYPKLFTFWKQERFSIAARRARWLAIMVHELMPDFANALRLESPPGFPSRIFSPRRNYVENLAQNLDLPSADLEFDDEISTDQPTDGTTLQGTVR